MDGLSKLPIELVWEILEYVTPYSVLCMSMVCKNWKAIVESTCVGGLAQKVLGNGKFGALTPTGKKEGMGWEDFKRTVGAQQSLLQGHSARGIDAEESGYTLHATKTKVFWIESETFLNVRNKAASAGGKEQVVWRGNLFKIYQARLREACGEALDVSAMKIVRRRWRTVILATGYDDDVAVFLALASLRRPQYRLIGFDLRTKGILWTRGCDSEDVSPSKRVMTAHKNLFVYMWPDMLTGSTPIRPFTVIDAKTGSIISRLKLLFTSAGMHVMDQAVSPDGMFCVVIQKQHIIATNNGPACHDDTILHVADTLTGETLATYSFPSYLNPEPALGSRAVVLAIDLVGEKGKLVPEDIEGYCEDVMRNAAGQRCAADHQGCNHNPEWLCNSVATRNYLIEKRRVFLEKSGDSSAEYTAFVKIYEFLGFMGRNTMDINVSRLKEGPIAAAKTFQVTIKCDKLTPATSLLPPSSSSTVFSSPPSSQSLEVPMLTTKLSATINLKEERTYPIATSLQPCISRALFIGRSLQWALHFYAANAKAECEILTFREETYGLGDDSTVNKYRMEVETNSILYFPPVLEDCCTNSIWRREQREPLQLSYSMCSGMDWCDFGPGLNPPWVEAKEEEGEITFGRYVLFFKESGI